MFEMDVKEAAEVVRICAIMRNDSALLPNMLLHLVNCTREGASASSLMGCARQFVPA